MQKQNESKTPVEYLCMNEIVVNKSKFVAYLFEVKSQQDVKNCLDFLKKEHNKATHLCYAYSIKTGQFLEKCSDDKEPSGTAGRPILNVLQKKNLCDKLIVVVRYFGGIKLGTGGLVRAYSKASSEIVKIFEENSL